MNKEKIEIFKVLRYICLSAILIFGLMTIVGSGGGGGGGGGGGPPSISYTGLTNQATIDENNAVQLVVGAYTGGVTGAVVGSGAVAQEKEIGRPRTLTISRALEKAIRHIDVTSALGSASFGAIITDSGTIDGNCGGSLSYTINIDNVTGDFTGNFNFNNYCEDGVTFSGNSSVSGIVNLGTEEIIELTISFDPLSISISLAWGPPPNTDSFTIKGSITYDDLQASPIDAHMDILMRDDSTGKVFWSRDYFLSITEGLDYIDLYIFGRYFDPDYGYVDVDTTTVLHISEGDFWPCPGVLLVEGDTGTAGGSTMAQLYTTEIQVLPSFIIGKIEVDADTNGDGTWDWNYSPDL